MTKQDVTVLQPSKKVNLEKKDEEKSTQMQNFELSRMLQSDIVVLPTVPPPVYHQTSNDTGSTMTAVDSDSGRTIAESTRVSHEKVDFSVVEKAHTVSWEGYEDEELPDKTQGHYLRNLRHQIFSLYRRLFGVVFVTNVAIFIATLAKANYNAQSIGLIVVSNIFCAVLMRQDYVINAFFNVFCAVPPSYV